MKKRIILKSWLVKVLGTIVGGYVFFCATTIDSLGNSTYDKILIGWTILSVISFYLLSKYSKVFED